MKKWLVFLLILCGCSKIIKVLEDGNVHTMEVSIFTHEDLILEQLDATKEVTTNDASCTYSGFCFNCGLKFNGKFECGVGMYVACQGHRTENLRLDFYKAHKKYIVIKKNRRPQEKEYISPTYAYTKTTLLSATNCR